MMWEKFADLFRHNTTKYITYFLPADRTSQDVSASPVVEGQAYCQLWLSEMYLSHDWEWFSGRYPVVHAATRYHYGNKLVTIPCVTEPELLSKIDKDHLNRIVQRNYRLTPIFPFNRGDVSLEAGMFSMKTNEPLQRVIKSMKDLTHTLTISAEFTTIVKLAEPIYKSVESVLDMGDYRLELGYYNTFVSSSDKFASNVIRPGYFVAILADDKEVDPKTLCVINGELHVGVTGKDFLNDHRRFEGHSYMLFRLAVRQSQEWNQITGINTLVRQAQSALIEKRKQHVNDFLLPQIKIEVLTSPDVAVKDQDAMIAKIIDNLKGHGLEATAREVEVQSLHAIMQRPLPSPDPKLEVELAELRKTLALPIR